MTPTAGLESNWTAITLIALLLIACIPLYRSMRKHMRRITVPSAAELRAREIDQQGVADPDGDARADRHTA